ncbi:MAG TPA: hypothetical protein VFL83_00505 [Anaeromyxobacter sp.]|nr:hypothetical protein [Anaeromyxobacter sp.]
MRFVKLLAVVALLGTAGSALAQDYVRVERRRSTAGVVLRDTLAGGVLGSAVAGGIILYEMGINDNDDYNWERTLAWGAIIGLGAGLVWGIVDVASQPSYAMVARAPVRDGLSLTLGRRDQSGVQRFPLLVKRF